MKMRKVFTGAEEMKILKDIFICTRCGYCCHGETTVSLNKEDRENMIKELKLPYEEIEKKYLRVNGDTVQMKIVDGHCIFYNEGCQIHKARPWQCRQWPFHPAVLKDEAAFTAIKTSCPGIKENIKYEEFCEVLKKVLKNSGKIIC